MRVWIATDKGDEMTLIKLKTHRVHGPLIFRRGGIEYSFTAHEKTKVPVGIAIWFIGNDEMEITFTKKDKDSILGFNEQQLDLLRVEFGIKGDATSVVNTMFPKKIRPPKISLDRKKETKA